MLCCAAQMSAEERKDLRKRTLARMKQLSLENLVELSEDGAKFVVLGSTGNHYTVTLSSQQQSCQCMDYRFRRHHCKHICLALSHLGILDDPGKWREASSLGIGRSNFVAVGPRPAQLTSQRVIPRWRSCA